MTRWLTLYAAVLIFAGAARSQSRFDVYYLAVGSQDYIGAADPAVHTFDTIDGVRKSARAVADFFDAGGSRYGVVLSSDEGRVVSLEDIYRSLDRLVARVRADRAANPLIVYYFAGHGVSEGISWNHFSIPGNVAYRGNLADVPVETLARSTVHTAELVEKLEKTQIPFLAILDNCYEGKAADFNSPVLTPAARQGLEQTTNVLKFMNEFHDTYPVLFSTEPGTTVTTAPDPRNPGAQVTGVAPLARRLLLIQDRSDDPLRLAELVSLMISAQLDRLTRPAVTNSLPVKRGDVVLWSKRSSKGSHTEELGTGAKPVVLGRAGRTR